MTNDTAQASLTMRDFLRADRLPTTWCPGCGLGIILNSIAQAIRHRGLDNDEVTMVSGIGCTGRMSGYVDANTIHTTHGRAPAFATGVKLAQPDMKVIVVMGDGDAMSIGGNHLVHAMRRNTGLVAVVVNNNVYGMTGGQTSPTTPVGGTTTTARGGSFERPMDLEALARVVGTPFFARATVNHTASLVMAIEAALDVEGFALVEVLSNCHVIYGRMNETPLAAQMIADMDDDTHRSNATLKRRALLPTRLVDGRVETGTQLLEASGVAPDTRVGRGILWSHHGSATPTERPTSAPGHRVGVGGRS